jgi:hypothetical protein
MNVLTLTTRTAPSLADAVADALAGALSGQGEHCLWCGGGPLRVTAVNVWGGEVEVRCPDCGSQLSGVVPRHRLGVPA